MITFRITVHFNTAIKEQLFRLTDIICKLTVQLGVGVICANPAGSRKRIIHLCPVGQFVEQIE